MLEEMFAEVESELIYHIIPFWKKMKDDSRGGFYGLVDFDLNLHRDSEKGCILNSRILWFFSNAYKLLNDKSLVEYARHAYKFLCEKFFDKKNGGVFWSVDAQGNVLDSTKHTYNQAFAIYALSSYYDITHDRTALDVAFSLYETIEKRCRDEEGYLESFTADFSPNENDKLSENGVTAERTMNTLLHVLEGYTELFRVTKNADVRQKLVFILNQFLEKIWNPSKQRQEVFFDKNFNSLIDLYSYGHDIETSWLVDRTLEILGNEVLSEKISPITKTIPYRILETAYRDNSVLNECECGKNNETRVWWVQAESVVGFMNAYQKTGDKKFLDAAQAVWTYIKNYIVDKRDGSEWFWCVDSERKPSTRQPIVEPWKCPYHNGRMCFEIISRIKVIK
ncbi:AGE family epimerase/isomerase [Treponema sp.]|uniref:AGE family epimerase/isomerase n=1 Tax=Treponema sp. TaxID=166 RepID=UPI003F007486